MELNDKITLNIFKDLSKKDLDKFERAKLIIDYCTRNDTSLRSFAKLVDFSYSTIQDWTRWINISKEDYLKLHRAGYNDTEIYRALRDNKINNLCLGKFENYSNKAIKFLKPLLNLKYKEKDLEKIKEIRDLSNRLLMKYERQKTY